MPRWPGALGASLLILAAGAEAARAQDACAAPGAAVRLDHAIIVVRDLDAAAARFEPLGFRTKAGRLHPDGLLNRHVKFRDGTGIELMTVRGTPASRMARGYAALLAAGEGGVYAALWTANMARVRATATRLGHTPRVTRLGAWEFLSLPGLGDAAAVFFGAGGLQADDPDSVLSHPNGAVGLEAAWIEAGPELERLLGALGSRPCGAMTLPNGVVGTRWALARGSLVLVEPRETTERRVLGVELRRAASGEASRVVEPLPGFWLTLR